MNFDLATQLVTAFGMCCTAFGAWKTAQGVRLMPNAEGRVGISRIASDNQEDWASSPLPSSLRTASKTAASGLIWILLGTILQALPVVVRIVFLMLPPS